MVWCLYLLVYVEHTVLRRGWLLEFWRFCRVLVQPQVVTVTHLLDPLQSLTVFHLSLSLQNRMSSRCVQFVCLHANVLPVE
jgi:hypothetical protein